MRSYAAEILKGQRKRLLENVSIKLDPAQIQALRKIATMKSIPYQTLTGKLLTDHAEGGTRNTTWLCLSNITSTGRRLLAN